MKSDLELDQHLRRTLAAVADTVHEEPGRAPAATSRSRRRRLLVAAGVSIAAVPLAAAAVVNFGPEYVDEIPPPDPIISGSIDGERYWVVDGRVPDRCEGSPSGIELIAEENNLVGREWNTSGAFFGEPTVNGCAPTQGQGLPEDSYYSDGGIVVGDGMLWMGELHPDVDEVRADLGSESVDVETFEHEGGRYYLLEVPPGTTTFTVEYVVDGQVLAAPSGERAEHVLPDE
jgi:hypothetical protein